MYMQYTAAPRVPMTRSCVPQVILGTRDGHARDVALPQRRPRTSLVYCHPNPPTRAGCGAWIARHTRLLSEAIDVAHLLYVLATSPMTNARRVTHLPLEPYPLVRVERHLGQAHLTLLGVEHDAAPQSYPWSAIQHTLAEMGTQGRVALEYFPPELEQTIYRHAVFGGYARRYASHAGITPFFGGIAHLATHTQQEILVLDPANSAAFQLLYLHLPLVAIAGGVGWWGYDLLQPRQRLPRAHQAAGTGQRGAAATPRPPRSGRRRVLQRVLASLLVSMGLAGVAWWPQDTRYRQRLQPLYREYALHMRDMRWVTIAQGLVQYGAQHPGRVVVVYPPTHLLDGIVHYLDHPDQRRTKYHVYARVLPGITKAIRAYRWTGDQWRLMKYEPIATDL
jgi:hypothetical protein